MRGEVWPLFDLRLTTERLEMRLPTEAELVELVLQAPDDLETDPSRPASPESPRPTATAVAQWYWRALGDWRVDHWRLPLAVRSEAGLLGFQELEAERFSALRTVETSSWLVPHARGQGIGKEMRAAVLSLAFGHLGAEVATTSAWEWNRASIGVSESLGYADNGWYTHEHLGRVGVQRRMVLERSAWDPTAWPVAVEGLDDCLDWFVRS